MWVSETISASARHLSARLRAQGVAAPELEARILIASLLGIASGAVLTHGDGVLSSQQTGVLEGLIRRRLAGEPIARIFGRREFWGLDFALAESSLIPRPDSETVIAAALDIFGKRQCKPHCVLDLGTGPGTLLLSLLHEWHEAYGLGVDRDEATLLVARANAQKFGLGGRAFFTLANWGSGLAPDCFDLIISNPPYIRSGDIPGLAIEVREHDPPLALDGGDDGLSAYRAILPQVRRLLKDQAVIIFEIGEDQGEAVTDLAQAAGFETEPEPRRDLAGHPRVVVGYMTRRLLGETQKTLGN